MKKFFRNLLLLLFLWMPMGMTDSFSQKMGKNVFQIQYHIWGRWKRGTQSGNVALEYERLMGEKNAWSFRVAFHPYFSNLSFRNNFYFFPVSIQRIFFNRNPGKFETGIGFAYRLEFYEGRINNYFFAPLLSLMYRREIERRWIFRAGITYVLGSGDTFSPNLGFGFRF